MICLGDQGLSPTRLEAEAAQLRMVQLFKTHFLANRSPRGEVISELEYMGRTTAAPNQPGHLLYPGKPELSRVMAALSEDFRRHLANRDFRKCDAMGVAGDAAFADLLEVTVASNHASAGRQLRDKLATLRETVNRIHNLRVDWQPANWRPSGPRQLYHRLRPKPDEAERFLCFMPTHRMNAPRGIILYEVHAVRQPSENDEDGLRPPLGPPLVIPDQTRENLRRRYRERPPTEENVDQWAREFLRDNPALPFILQMLVFLAGMLYVLAVLVAMLRGLPGADRLAARLAMALLAAAEAIVGELFRRGHPQGT
jgi:hypothetical protein